MKDETKLTLENSSPTVPDEQVINHALDMLYADEEHNITDEVVNNLTYEEIIGALLIARDMIEDRKYADFLNRI